MRRLDCLSALFSLVLWVGALAAVAWFGVAAYEHVRDYQAISVRTGQVGQAWADDPATLARAATGEVARPAGLSSQPFQQAGARATTAYTTAGTTLTLRTTRLTCEPDPLTVDVVESPVAVQVLVRVDRPWLPPVGRWWQEFRHATECTNGVEATTVTAALRTGLGRRILVDSVTGSSVRKA